MKKIIIFSVFISSVLLLTNTGWALTMSDVGSVDTYLGYRTVAPGENDPVGELAWVNSLVDPDVVWGDKTDFSTDGYSSLSLIEGTSATYAFKFETDAPAYFLIKTGAIKAGGEKEQYDILLANIANLDYAVFDLATLSAEIDAQLDGFEISEIEKISHLSEFGSAPVPEPATLFLLGSGLMGLAGLRRRANK